MERLPCRTTKAGPLSVDPPPHPEGTCSCSPAFCHPTDTRAAPDEWPTTAIATGNASGSVERGGPFDNFGCCGNQPASPPRAGPAPLTPAEGHRMIASEMPECTTCGHAYPSHLAAALCCDVEFDTDRDR